MSEARQEGATAALGAGSCATRDPAATAYVRALTARSGSSFLWGMRLLPRRKRDAMYAIYAFCRAVDDVADEASAREVKLAELAAWRREVERVYDGRPTRPIARALVAPVEEFALPREEFLAVIDGMEMDAGESIRAPALKDFELYCRRVAGAVGMLSVHVFGEVGPAGRELAVVLGEGLQTTNILRDLAEDAARGRLYLPRELLKAHAIEAREPAAVLAHPALPAVCAALAERAHARLDRARTLIGECDRGRVRPARLMLEIYDRLLARLEARGWERPEVTVRLSRAEKLRVALRFSLF